jgi:cell division protein FtsL
LASVSHAHSAVADPVVPRTRPRRRTRRRAQRRARGGILWIAISGILLAGVVFVNVAVLRLNLALDTASSERTKLRAENAALQSQLSSELASSQIQTRAARELGLVYVDPSQYRYVNVAK